MNGCVRPDTNSIVKTAWKNGIVVPGFNIPYLPMMEPVIKALEDTNSFGLIMVARLEWVKFEAKSLKAVRNEYEKLKDENHTRLHLDHVPVIDEDGVHVDYKAVIEEAIKLGYQSVMVDGSRLSFSENMKCTREIAELARGYGIASEGELGAVMGHEAGPLPPYEEMFKSGEGFTDVAEASEFVRETGVDWLSVAVGNIHGAISAAVKDKQKPSARLNISHLEEINRETRIPLVLHGGTGISSALIRDAVKNGIAKVNVATAIRQPYEQGLKISREYACKAVYDKMIGIINNDLEIAGSANLMNSGQLEVP